MADCTNALKEWTGKARATVIYDSNVDEFTAERLFDEVKGKPNIALVGTTTDGDVFGGFFSVAATEQDEDFDDPDMFIFSFESHGRCKTPQRFVLKKELKDNAFVSFDETDSDGFVYFAVFAHSGLLLGNEKSKSYCFHISDAFDGLEDTTLTGTCGFCGYHHCARLVAVQLE